MEKDKNIYLEPGDSLSGIKAVSYGSCKADPHRKKACIDAFDPPHLNTEPAIDNADMETDQCPSVKPETL